MTRHTLNTLELIDMAIGDLQAMRSQVQWLQSQLDGRRRTGGAGPVSSSTRPDPTGLAAVGNWKGPGDSTRSLVEVIRGKLHATHRDLRWLVNAKTGSWLDRLQLVDEEPRPSDANEGTGLGPAELTGGVSAYRGDTKVDSATRADLQEALAAQRRRLERGEGFGDA